MAGQKFQYDESGATFFYFLLSFLALLLIPGTYYWWPRKQKEGNGDQWLSPRQSMHVVYFLLPNYLNFRSKSVGIWVLLPRMSKKKTYPAVHQTVGTDEKDMHVSTFYFEHSQRQNISLRRHYTCKFCLCLTNIYHIKFAFSRTHFVMWKISYDVFVRQNNTYTYWYNSLLNRNWNFFLIFFFFYSTNSRLLVFWILSTFIYEQI